jgi:agmatine deiminase
LSGDDTDSHIDTLARFCDPGTIAYQTCTDATDNDDASLKEMEQELRAFRTPAGEPYRLVPLPWPQPRCDEEGRRLPAGYANFLIINGAVLAPTYDDPADAQALARLRACFPGREVIGIPSLPLIQQYGSLHCVTMQLPAGVL